MRILFVLSFLFTFGLAAGQSRQSLRDMQYAREAMAQGDIDWAQELLKKAVDRDPDYRDAHVMLGELFLRQKNYESAISSFDEALTIQPGYFLALFRRGNAFFYSENFEGAIDDLEAYLESDGASDRGKKEAEKKLANARFGKIAKANAVPFSPVNLGDEINGPYMEYFPAITADGNELTFTRNQPEGRNMREDFYVSTGGEGSWAMAQPLDRNVNSAGNEGALCLSADGNVAVFTACQREDGRGSCDLYMTIRENGQWGKPFNLGYPINTDAWESQPSISPDGTTIYFTSNRSGGFGGKDLWKSVYAGSGDWGEPINLGDSINTKDDEVTPFMHWDGQSLYFASDGHPGVGDFDLYVTRKKNEEEWSTPQNLGYPINSVREENGLIVAPDGKTGYYSREGYADSRGMLDLYRFDLPEKTRALPIAYVNGTITDALTKRPLSATIEFVDLETGETYLEMTTGSQGYYFACLPGQKNFALNVRQKGYLFYSENFELTESTESTAELLDVALIPIKAGEKLTLKNVFFDSGSSELRESSYPELERTAEFLKQNLSVRCELSGHTDNIGSASANEALSKARALAVVNYLVEAGVERSRMEYAGYGDQQPITTNETEEGRQRNRRTELKIIQN